MSESGNILALTIITDICCGEDEETFHHLLQLVKPYTLNSVFMRF